MLNSNPMLWPRPPMIVRYVIAGLSVGAALVIGQLPALHLQAAPVSLFLCAVMFSAWFGGVGPGLLAVLLSVLAFDYYVLLPLYTLALKPDEIPRLAVFALSALFVGSLSAAQRSAAESLRRGRDELEATGQELERTNEALRAENSGRRQIEDALRRSEAYLTEAQRISRTGSFGWNVSSGEILWSDETFRILEYDRTTKPAVELVIQRVHPEDAAFVKQTIERASQDGKDLDFENRLLMPDGSIKHVQVVAHASSNESSGIEFVGAVMDVTATKLTEERLRQREIELRQVLDLAPQHVGVVDFDGRSLYLNQAGLDYHGITFQEWRSTGLRRFLHPDDLERIESRAQTKFLGGSPRETEARLQRSDGKYRWFLARSSPMRDEQGRITRWYIASTDIEDRKQAETLLAGEKRLLEMIARGDALTFILDALCRLVEDLASGSLTSILLLDANTNQLRHGAAPSLPTSYSEAIDGIVIGPSVGSCGTAAYRAEAVIVSDIGSDPLWTDFRGLALEHGLRACWSRPILSSGGRVLGTFATYYREPRSPTAQEHEVIEQVTHLASIAIERKQAEEVLREQASLLDLTHDTVFVRDMSDVITYWNRGAEELYGWTREQAVDKVSHQLTQTIFPAPLEEINAELLRAGRWEGELIHTKRDGTPVTVASRWSLQRDERGLPAAILETNNDITERKRAEQALQNAQTELAHVTRVTTLGEMTASIAHEINQPLAAVVTNGSACLRWLMRVPPNLEEAREASRRVIRDGNRASEVIARIRALMRKTDTQKTELDINEAIREIVLLTQHEARRKGVRLRLDLAAHLPPVLGDRVQLQQVALNLVMNGVEAMAAVRDRARELIIRSRAHESDQVLVAVQDRGVGIDQQDIEKIFSAFYTTKSQGMGMGLAISRSIIEAHGGRLWATPNEDQGATMQFTIPMNT